MRRILLALSLLVFAAACGDDPVSNDTVVGTWVLASIGGDALPAPFEGGTVTAGSFTVSANMQFTFSETYTQTGANPTTDVVHGSWALSGATITFTPTDAEDNTPISGTVSGSTITITFDAGEGARIYNKQ